MTDKVVTYSATKTGEEFHADRSFFKLMFGPVSCGKSVACVANEFAYFKQQAPSSDGIRYTRTAIIRNSYRQLKSTTIKTWCHWFPESVFGKVKWDSPITHHIKFDDVDAEVMFMPIENENDLDNLKSLELTRAYINEAQYMPKSVITTCLERVGRFPHKNSGAVATYPGVVADTNPPSTKHWMFELEKKLPSNYKVFHYDSAVIKVAYKPAGIESAVSRDGTVYINNPQADYLQNIADINYYLRQIPGLSDEEVKVTCMGQYGFTRAGKPVYTDYNDTLHYINERITYNPHEKLVIGWDFGNTPACSLLQLQPNGSIAQIYEFCSEDFGIEKLALDLVIPVLNIKFKGWQNDYLSFGDPSGMAGNQVTYEKKTCIGALNSLGIRTRPASTNSPDLRMGAVSYFLRKTSNGKGGFFLTMDCQTSREGMLGDYQFEKIQLATVEESIKPKPLKNFSSHICEATQYAMLWYHEMATRSIRGDSPSISTKIY